MSQSSQDNLAEGATGIDQNYQNICTICKDVMTTDQEIYLIATCSHEFHRNCIENSISHSSECPSCKTVFQLSELVKKRLEAPIAKNSPTPSNRGRGKGRGALAKKHFTRNYSKTINPNVSQQPLLELSSANYSINQNDERTDTILRNSPSCEPIYRLSPMRSLEQIPDQTDVQKSNPTVDVTQLNQIIEVTLTKLLKKLNVLPTNIPMARQEELNVNNAHNLPQPQNANSYRNRPSFTPNSMNTQTFQAPRQITEANPLNMRTSFSPEQIPSENFNVNNARANLNLTQNHSFRDENFTMRADKVTSIIQNWNLKFDGSRNGLHVEEFLYRVKALTIDNFNGNFSVICKNLHILLTGKARNWFWDYHRKTERIEWTDFCAALKYEYKDFRSNFDIQEDIRNRKMKPGETFENFYEAVTSMLARLETPMPESEIVEILTRNLLPDVRRELLYVPIFTIAHLRKLVQMRENLLGDDYVRRNLTSKQPQNYNNKRAVAELDFPVESIPVLTPTAELVVDAIRQGPFTASCWNCEEQGHHWEDCLRDRVVFCYGCGAKNTYKPQCARCSSKKLASSKN